MYIQFIAHYNSLFVQINYTRILMYLNVEDVILIISYTSQHFCETKNNSSIDIVNILFTTE